MADRDGRQEKKSFWGSLFRSKSLSRRLSGHDNEHRRASDGDALPRRPRRSSPPDKYSSSPGSSRRRSRNSDPEDGNRNGSVRRSSSRNRRAKPPRSGSHGRPSRLPLTSWPPSNMSSREELTLGRAMELISSGVPAHKGHKRPIPHAPDRYFVLYATSAGNHSDETDSVNLHDSMTQFMTLRIQGSGSGRSSDPAIYPWDTLEQPSYAFYHGRIPGTVTLNQWTTSASSLAPTIALRDSGYLPREVNLAQIFERLGELESSRGAEESEENLYRTLYRRFLRDPDRANGSPRRTIDRQITDLILVLSRPDYWIDFSDPRNQVATRFIFDTSSENAERYTRFCQQLLLSLELEIRIQARTHGESAKEKLLEQLPPTIRWDLALAKRWRENIHIETWGKKPADVRLLFKLRKRQMRMLKRFAQVMKWPNLRETMASMKEKDEDDALDVVSSDALAFFSGLILPGPTFPFLIMNTLIDLDPDKKTDALALLTHLHPNCGFQHRSSYTYWSATSIIGKVIAPTCHALAGWIGPARPSPDLRRSQIVRVRSRKPAKLRLSPEDVTSMSERSDPLGPPAEVFPVEEYELVTPKHRDDVGHDGVRIELLGLKAMPGVPAAADGSVASREDEPSWYDANIQFAIDGVSWPLRLAYDVSFVTAWPCQAGPHPLFFDYVFETIKADQIVGVRDWGGLYYGGNSERRGSTTAQGPPGSRSASASGQGGGGGVSPAVADEVERVLVVEAFGVADNEVLARAWCSHWGLSAMVANVGKTCVACAVREAYAATLTVVILIDEESGRDAEL